MRDLWWRPGKSAPRRVGPARQRPIPPLDLVAFMDHGPRAIDPKQPDFPPLLGDALGLFGRVWRTWGFRQHRRLFPREQSSRLRPSDGRLRTRLRRPTIESRSLWQLQRSLWRKLRVSERRLRGDLSCGLPRRHRVPGRNLPSQVCGTYGSLRHRVCRRDELTAPLRRLQSALLRNVQSGRLRGLPGAELPLPSGHCPLWQWVCGYWELRSPLWGL